MRRSDARWVDARRSSKTRCCAAKSIDGRLHVTSIQRLHSKIIFKTLPGPAAVLRSELKIMPMSSIIGGLPDSRSRTGQRHEQARPRGAGFKCPQDMPGSRTARSQRRLVVKVGRCRGDACMPIRCHMSFLTIAGKQTADQSHVASAESCVRKALIAAGVSPHALPFRAFR